MKPRRARRHSLEGPSAGRPFGNLGAALVLAALGFALAAHPARAADVAKGKALYDLNCVSCHGTGGKGDGPTGAALAAQGTPARDFTRAEFVYDADGDGTSGTDADLHAVIKNGAGAYGGSPLMAPWAHLGDAAIADIVAHIRTFHP
jgi:mono/diheme cytochrome c family protein